MLINNIPCVILSGGKSSRMGEDKSLLPFKDSSTLIEYQYKKLSKIFKDTYISSKMDKFNFDANIIYDNDKNVSSPMIALYSILEHLNFEKVFIITVDTPFVKKDTIFELIDNSSIHDIVIAKDTNKTHNLCGVFSKSINSTIKNMLSDDNHKINTLIKKSNHKIILFENSKQFLNINTQDDYKYAISSI